MTQGGGRVSGTTDQTSAAPRRASSERVVSVHQEPCRSSTASEYSRGTASRRVSSRALPGPGPERRRELEHDRPELAARAKRLETGEEGVEDIVNGLGGRLVGDLPRDLESEPESFGRSLGPSTHEEGTRSSVEARIDLDGTEHARVAAEEVAGGRSERIERADPIVVRPSGATDPVPAHKDPQRRRALAVFCPRRWSAPSGGELPLRRATNARRIFPGARPRPDDPRREPRLDPRKAPRGSGLPFGRPSRHAARGPRP